MIHPTLWDNLEFGISTKPHIALIISFTLSIFGFINFKADPDNIWKIVQICTAIISSIISVVTFYFVIIKPHILSKKKKRKSYKA